MLTQAARVHAYTASLQSLEDTRAACMRSGYTLDKAVKQRCQGVFKDKEAVNSAGLLCVLTGTVKNKQSWLFSFPLRPMTHATRITRLLEQRRESTLMDERRELHSISEKSSYSNIHKRHTHSSCPIRQSQGTLPPLGQEHKIQAFPL